MVKGECIEMKVLIVDPKKCVECGLCELACSYSKEHKFTPRRARIRIVPRNIIVCRHCKKPICIDACKFGAITKDELTGAVLINDQKCVGCRACIPACPFGGILLTPEGTVVKCDLCGGDPECVKHCYFNAIRWVEASGIIMKR
jgi:Fe-S-cluster-containing hydrogenase component 2